MQSCLPFLKRVILEAKESKVCLESRKPPLSAFLGKSRRGSRAGLGVCRTRDSASTVAYRPAALCFPNKRHCLWLSIPNLASIFGHLPFSTPLISPHVHIAYLGAYINRLSFVCWVKSPRKVSIVLQYLPPGDLPSRTVQCVKHVKVIETTHCSHFSVFFLSDN